MDLLAKAQEPGLLRFGICWQRDPEEAALPFEGDSRFRILAVDWRDSRGACWARAEIMKLWQDEQWFLQIDSHCRFVEHWDTKLIRMMGQTGSAKPILSTYVNGFTPREAGSSEVEFLGGPPQLMALEGFTHEGLPMLKPLTIPGASKRDRPVRARFLAAGFLFAAGTLVQEVPYDPELYFFGEEVSMTLRAFTAGYDLFHPAENVVWHDYVRAYAVRHWNDEAPEATSGSSPRTAVWSDLDKVSRQRVRHLLRGDRAGDEAGLQGSELGRFGLGSARTLEEYEAFAGVSFELRKLQDYTRYAGEPPNPTAPSDWPDRIYTWLVRVAVSLAALSPGALDTGSFWVLSLQDNDYREIRRQDFQRKEMDIHASITEVILICEMQSGIIPSFWSVQPFSLSHGWGQRLQGTLAESDFSIVVD